MAYFRYGSAHSRGAWCSIIRSRLTTVTLLTALVTAVVGPSAVAHKNPETGVSEATIDNTAYTTPALFHGKRFQNPKMSVLLQDNSPSTWAYDTGPTSTSAYIDWDLALLPTGGCESLPTPYNRILLQKRDLDANGNPLTSWRTTNGMTHYSACLNGDADPAHHWGPDSISFVNQGGSDFEMRLLDETTGNVYLTAAGPAYFIRPTAPTSLLIADVSTASVRIEWLNNARFANMFDVERRTDPTGAWTRIAQTDAGAKGTLHSFNDTSVQSGVEYVYRVRAVNGSTGVSDYSNEAATQAAIIDRERTFGDALGINPTGELGDPVNTLTGSFVTEVADLRLPGIGVPFTFIRRYNSADASVGVLGRGWNHPFETNLTFPNSSKVKVKGSDGQRMTFVLQPDGTYKGETGARAQLVALPGAYEVRHFDGSLERYDTYGNLYQVKDHNGNKLTVTGRGSSGITAITDSVGRVVTLTYSGLRLSGVSLPDGRSVSYGYTGDGLLQTVTDARGALTTYSYDTAGRLTKMVDQNGTAMVTNTYNGAGRVTRQVDARNQEWLFGWDVNNQTATVTDPRGNRYQDVYRGNVLRRRVDPMGSVVAFDYDMDLNLVVVTDPRGKATSMTYDGRGNMLTRTAPTPLSYQETWTYDARNRPTSHTNGRGFTTTFQYDSKGNLELVEQPGSVVTDLVRDPVNGLVTSVIDPRSKATTYRYDSHGNLIEVRKPGGGLTKYVYDGVGRMIGVIEPRGNVAGANVDDFKTTFTYNAADQMTTVTDPLGRVTSKAYDPGGRMISVTDAKNRTTAYAYNPANLLTSVTAPDGTVTAYAYDAAGNVSSRTDAKNRTTTYDNDSLNRLMRVTSPTGQRWDYEYDPASNLVKVTDAAGNSTPDTGDGMTIYSYDALNRLRSIDYSDSTPDVALLYDANGNLTSMDDEAGTETYAYDELDRLTSVTRGTQTFSYHRDKSGNITRRTYPDGTVSDLSYEADGRLATVTTDGQVTSYAYDVAGNLATTTLPSGNGYVETRGYDRGGNLISVTSARNGSVLTRAEYVRDPVGNPTTIITTAGSETYSYDRLDRLTEVCYQASCTGANDPFIRYTYDAVGNRLSEERPSGTMNYDYNAADQLISATAGGGTTTYEHDANGNMTRAGSRSFTYDGANRTTTVSDAGATTTYRYDGMGKRVGASTGTGPSDVTKYLWDVTTRLPELALERDGNDALVRRYEHGLDVISSSSGASRSYYHYDALGSVSALTSGSGQTQWTYSYEPFGSMKSLVKVDETAAPDRVRFTGEYQDPTGLYHLRARQYSPEQARFLGQDPWPPQARKPYAARYAYTDNRPTVLVDPTGMVSFSICGSLSAGFFIGGFAQLCVGGTGLNSVGGTATAGIGAHSPNASGAVQLQTSNAQDLHDLEGVASYVGATIPVPPVGVAVDGFSANVPCHSIDGGEIGISTPTAEEHFGVSYTDVFATGSTTDYCALGMVSK